MSPKSLFKKNVRRGVVAPTAWHSSFSFSALIACLCVTILRTSPISRTYDALPQTVLLVCFTVFLLAWAALSRSSKVTTALSSRLASVLIFALISPLWVTSLYESTLPVFASGANVEGNTLLATGWMVAFGLSMLIFRWFLAIKQGTRKRLFESTFVNVLIPVCFLALLNAFAGTLVGAVLLLLVAMLACLFPGSASVLGAEQRGKERKGEEKPRTTHFEKLLIAVLCVVGFAFQALGILAQGAQSGYTMNAIYLAGGIVVLVFLAAQIYLVRRQEAPAWKELAAVFTALIVILAAFIFLPHRGDLMAGVKTTIVFFGATCFLVGTLLFTSLYAHYIGRWFIRTALLVQGALYGSMALATYVARFYGETPGSVSEDSVLILLLLVALATAGFVMLLLSHKKLAKVLTGALGGQVPSDDLTPNSTEFPVQAASQSFEDLCGELQRTYNLTPREGDVLLHAARGKTAAAIAESLYISRDTASTHTQHIYRKLGVNSRDSLIEFVDAYNSGKSGASGTRP